MRTAVTMWKSAAPWSALLLAAGLSVGAPSPAAPLGSSIFKSRAPSVVYVACLGPGGAQKSSGSGAVIEMDAGGGVVLTNNHVIDGCYSLRVAFTHVKTPGEFSGTSSPATLIRTEPGLDLALLRVTTIPSGVTAIPLGELATAQSPGEPVFAIGHPKGYVWTLTEGVISAFRRRGQQDLLADADLIQTQAPLSPGNSGGPLLDSRGLLIGVNTLGRTDGQNLNYAVAVSEVRGILARARTQGSGSRPDGAVVDRCTGGCLDRESAAVVRFAFVEQFTTDTHKAAMDPEITQGDDPTTGLVGAWWRMSPADAKQLVEYRQYVANCRSDRLIVLRAFAYAAASDAASERVEHFGKGDWSSTKPGTFGDGVVRSMCAVAGLRASPVQAMAQSAGAHTQSARQAPLTFRNIPFGASIPSALTSLGTARCKERNGTIECSNEDPCSAARGDVLRQEAVFAELVTRRSEQITRELYAQSDRKAKTGVGGLLGGVLGGLVVVNGRPAYTPKGKIPTHEEVMAVLDQDPAVRAAKAEGESRLATLRHCEAQNPNWEQAPQITFADYPARFRVDFAGNGMAEARVDFEGDPKLVEEALAARYGETYRLGDRRVWLPPGGRVELDGSTVRLASAEVLEARHAAIRQDAADADGSGAASTQAVQRARDL